MRKSIVAAIAKNGVIGKEGKLPWHLPADLKKFKELTMGHHMLMGRPTFEAIGRALPGRTSIVLTRDRSWSGGEGVIPVNTLEQGFEAAKGDDELFIVGGAEVYRQTIEMVDRLYLTMIDQEFEGDTYFPGINYSGWDLVTRQKFDRDENNSWDWSFVIYDRPAVTHTTRGPV
jgi:dihydrofolate reductase